MTGCLEIERQYHKRLIFVSVGIRNLGQQAAEFDTEHFIFVDREGRSFDPVDVRSDFNYAPWLLPRSGLIPPGKWRVGWLTSGTGWSVRSPVSRLRRPCRDTPGGFRWEPSHEDDWLGVAGWTGPPLTASSRS